MDIKKLQGIIDNSQLSEPAKDLIQDLIPEAGRPEIQEEILKTIDYEIKMNGLAADEFEEVVDQLHMAEKKMDAADKIEDEELDELNQKYEEKMDAAEADIKQNLQYKDNLIKAVSGEAGAAPVLPPTPVASVDPVVPVEQNPGYGGQQYNANSQPTTYPPVPVMGE